MPALIRCLCQEMIDEVVDTLVALFNQFQPQN